MPRRRGMAFGPEHVERVSRIKELSTGASNRDSRKFYGKIHFKKGAFPAGRGKAQRVFLKEYPDEWQEHSSFGRTACLTSRKRIEKELAIRQKLKVLGLPVPKAGIVGFLEEKEGVKSQKLFLAVEPFLRKGNKEPKIHAINTPIMKGLASFMPLFLSNFKAAEDRQLIENLGKDIATMANAGIVTPYLDFFGFYRRSNGKWERVIMDTEEFSDCNAQQRSFLARDETGQRPESEFIEAMAAHAGLVWKFNSPEFRLFWRSVMEKAGPEIKRGVSFQRIRNKLKAARLHLSLKINAKAFGL